MCRIGGTTAQNDLRQRCAAEVYNPTHTPWAAIREDILRIERAAFGVQAFSEGILRRDFTDVDSIVILLRDTEIGKIVGFTYAEPGGYGAADDTDEDQKTAYINDTVLDPHYRGQQLVGVMMSLLERELIARGYAYLERDAVVANRYAANIQKVYGSRIVTSTPHDSIYGPQVFFRIRLDDDV